MPCRDEWAEEQDRKAAFRELALVRASLCAVLTFIEGDDTAFAAMLKDIDWKEAGVSKKEFLSWWETHKHEDIQRRKREAAEKREKELRANALAKLTLEERKLLGIKP